MFLVQRDGWIAATAQAWKMYVFDIVMLGGLVCSVGVTYSFGYRNPVPWKALAWVCGLLVTSIGGLIWLSTSLRCGACKRAVGWHVVSTASANAWVRTLETMMKCPCCGDRPGEITRN